MAISFPNNLQRYVSDRYTLTSRPHTSTVKFVGAPLVHRLLSEFAVRNFALSCPFTRDEFDEFMIFYNETVKQSELPFEIQLYDGEVLETVNVRFFGDIVERETISKILVDFTVVEVFS